MKEIRRADNSGFCFGVKAALEKTEEQIQIHQGRKIYTCGPLIHNKLVTDSLQKRGVEITEGLENLAPGDTVIIRSHGAPERFYQEAGERQICLVDACLLYTSRCV